MKVVSSTGRSASHGGAGGVYNQQFSLDNAEEKYNFGGMSHSASRSQHGHGFYDQTPYMQQQYQQQPEFTPIPEEMIPVLTKDGYTCTPSIEQLSRMTEEDLASVKEFTVSRAGYGSLTWQEPVDLRGMNLDEMIYIERMSVTIKDAMRKRVTVSLAVEYKNVDQKKVRDKLMVQCEKTGYKFLNWSSGAYAPNIGRWEFEIPHDDTDGENQN